MAERLREDQDGNGHESDPGVAAPCRPDGDGRFLMPTPRTGLPEVGCVFADFGPQPLLLRRLLRRFRLGKQRREGFRMSPEEESGEPGHHGGGDPIRAMHQGMEKDDVDHDRTAERQAQRNPSQEQEDAGGHFQPMDHPEHVCGFEKAQEFATLAARSGEVEEVVESVGAEDEEGAAESDSGVEGQ